MFDFVANILTIILTVLFPIFASYKALRTSSPLHLAPWLMYWIVLSLSTSFESFSSPILHWLPFYAWLRLFLHLYLVLPGNNQGATFLYQEYIHPFLARHEAEIEEFVSKGHDRAKAMGLEYVQMAIEFVKRHLLGSQPQQRGQQRPEPPGRQVSYATALLSHFNLPSARDSMTTPAGDLFGLLASALQNAPQASTTRSQKGRDLIEDLIPSSGTIVPTHLATPEERLRYIASQQEKLAALMRALDKEGDRISSTATAKDGTGAQVDGSRSESEFERVEHDDVGTGNARGGKGKRQTSGGGWLPYGWGWGGVQREQGRSSGVDR